MSSVVKQVRLIGAKLLQTKSIDKSILQSDQKKTLRWYDLLTYGISATVGGGIYVVVGEVALTAGPAVSFSVLCAGFLSLLTAFCYLELAALIPATGSNYVYGFSFMGEFIGYSLGWIATLEYAFAAAITASAWSSYLNDFLSSFDIHMPAWLHSLDLGLGPKVAVYLRLNLIAVLLVVLMTLIVVLGVELSAKFNNALTSLNILVILAIIVAGATAVQSSNWTPLAPFGAYGVFHGAGTMIYSYIGFDTICNLASDAVSPMHLQVAVVGTVFVATALYVCVAIVLTGMVPFHLISAESSLSHAFVFVQMKGVSYIVRVCAFSTMLATLLACLNGQPRMFLLMSKDGFLPALFHKEIRPQLFLYNILFSSGIAAVIAAFIRPYILFDVVALGALLAFAANACGLLLSRFRFLLEYRSFAAGLITWVFFGSFLTWVFYQASLTILFFLSAFFCIVVPSFGICWLFYRHSDQLYPIKTPGQHLFICPLMPVIPLLVIIGNSFVMTNLGLVSFYQLFIWIGLGTLLYVLYGYRNSAKLESRADMHSKTLPSITTQTSRIAAERMKVASA